MLRRVLPATAIGISLLVGTIASAQSYKVVAVKDAPKGAPKSLAPMLPKQGAQLQKDGKAVVDVWLFNKLALRKKFKPSPTVKYPFQPGQLIGLMKVADGAEFTDFRGQDLQAGVYTLRYAHQPQDGNHFGEILDFLLALPAKGDSSPKLIASYDELVERSAESVGTTHPAIFSLVAPKKDQKKDQKLEHDDNKDYWILETSASGEADGKSVAVPLRVIVVGKTDE